MPGSQPAVFVVDDDEAMRDALSTMVRLAGMKIETYASAQEFLNTYEHFRPGCLVLDVNMPVMNGLDLQQVLIKRNMRLPVILISGSGEVPIVVRGMSAGAIDFLEKPFTEQALLNRIRQAFDIDARRRTEAELIQSWADRFSTLTPREQEVMQLLCVGKSGKEIAARLGVSYKTVEKFRAKVMHKMQAGNMVELLTMAKGLERAPAARDVPDPPCE